MSKKDLFVVVLVTFFITSTLFMATPTKSNPTATDSSNSGYNPWADINGDGQIDIYDVILVAGAFGTSGTPVQKASINYDSGWINITDKCGQYFNITHNLNSTDLMVDITGKTALDGGVHQRNIGLAGFQPGWSRTFADVSSSASRRLIKTSDGGFAFAGDGSDGAVQLVKTDSIGNIIWNKSYGVLRSSYSVVQTSDGGYAVAGDYIVSPSNRDFWLVKTDADGNKQWESTYGGAGIEVAYSMIQTSDGGYAMAGGTNSFGPNYDGWLVKTNSTGDVQWSRNYGGAGWDEDFRSVVQTREGGYVMAGETNGFVGNIWLVKTDADGNMQWNYSYGAGTAIDVIQTADGGYAMPGALGLANLVKTDANGILQWSRKYPSLDGAYSIVETSDEGYALAGYKFYNGNSAFSVVKTDASGNIQWSRTYDSPEQDFADSVVQTRDGGFAILGSAGAGSIWLVKTDVEYGLAWTDSTANTLTLYRGATDPYWNFVRVRIWEPKTSP